MIDFGGKKSKMCEHHNLHNNSCCSLHRCVHISHTGELNISNISLYSEKYSEYVHVLTLTGLFTEV